MHLLLSAEDSEAELRAELGASLPAAPIQEIHGLLLGAEFNLTADRPLPWLVFARQFFPNARQVSAGSIRAWAELVYEALVEGLPVDQPWSLHIEPHYGGRTIHRMGARAWHTARKGEYAAPSTREPSPGTVPAEAGRHRCQLIKQAVTELLQKKRRQLLRQLRAEPAVFTATDSFAQVLLTTPEGGFISLARAPVPHRQRHLLWPFPKGEIAAASDKAAPSRAFAKLAEAELRMGRTIQPGETCVDLGAAPGSWTYYAARRGAPVIAVDHSPLRDDLMRHRQVAFQRGDAFRFKPERPVDWLLCDVIAAPERTAKLLLDWLQQGWCRRFVVTIKLKDADAGAALALLKGSLPPLCSELFLTRLCANKKEACAFGAAV